MRQLAFILFSLPALAGVEQFNGRWNILVENEARGRAWWLEVEGAGTRAIRGKFVGAPGGQVDIVPRMQLNGQELVFVIEKTPRRPGESGKAKRPDKHVYRCRLTGNDSIEGTYQLEGRPGSLTKWSGLRAPVIQDRDDGSWKPANPVALFNGKDLTGWTAGPDKRPMAWEVHDGVLVNNPPAADIQSVDKFWNFRLQVEYRVGPKSNSGIGLRGRYEVQILEDFGRKPDGHSTGAIYSRIVPATNASKPAGQWQTLDVTLIGRTVTVIHNGVTLIDKGLIEGPTAISKDPYEDRPGPIILQGDHGKVEFRKIVVTPLLKQ